MSQLNDLRKRLETRRAELKTAKGQKALSLQQEISALENRIRSGRSIASQPNQPTQTVQSNQNQMYNSVPDYTGKNLDIDTPAKTVNQIQDVAANIAQTNFQNSNPVSESNEYGSKTISFDEQGRPVIKTSLSEGEKGLREGEREKDLSLLKLGGELTNQAKGRLGDPREGLQGYDRFNLMNGPDVQGYNNSNFQSIRDLNNNNLPSLDVPERERIESELYGRRTRYLDKRYEREKENLRQSLADQGINPGSPKFNQLTEDFENQWQGLYSDEMGKAISDAGNEQSRQFGLSSQSRAQTFGERQALGEFDFAKRGMQSQEELNRENSQNQSWQRYQDAARSMFDQSNLVRQNQFSENTNAQMLPFQQMSEAYKNYQGVKDPQFVSQWTGYNQQMINPYDALQLQNQKQQAERDRASAERIARMRSAGGGGSAVSGPYFEPTKTQTNIF